MENENSGWGRQDVDLNSHGNAPTDGWGHSTDRDGLGNTGQDVQGNDWHHGADHTPSGDEGGFLDFIFGLFGG